MSEVPDVSDLLRRWDELPWVEVMSGIRAAIIPVDPELHPGQTLLVPLHYPANYHAPRHWHTVGHAEIILKGSLFIGGREEVAGSIRVVPPKFKYGPIETRDEDCWVVEVFPVATAEAATGFEGEIGVLDVPKEVGEATRLLGIS